MVFTVTKMWIFNWLRGHFHDINLKNNSGQVRKSFGDISEKFTRGWAKERGTVMFVVVVCRFVIFHISFFHFWFVISVFCELAFCLHNHQHLLILDSLFLSCCIHFIFCFSEIFQFLFNCRLLLLQDWIHSHDGSYSPRFLLVALHPRKLTAFASFQPMHWPGLLPFAVTV